MGVMDKFKNLVGVVDDDEIENEYVEPSEADINRAAADLGNYEKSGRSSKGFGRDRKIVPMSGGNMKLVVIEPKAFEESPELVNSLKDRKPVNRQKDFRFFERCNICIERKYSENCK